MMCSEAAIYVRTLQKRPAHPTKIRDCYGLTIMSRKGHQLLHFMCVTAQCTEPEPNAKMHYPSMP